MAKDRANRTRKNELKIYLSDNEKYILDRKVELSKRKSASDYIRTLILFGFVYEYQANNSPARKSIAT